MLGVPGCGKTFIIEERAEEDGATIDPADCLVLVFARRSRAVVVDRMEKRCLVNEVSTIHSHRLRHLKLKFVNYEDLLRIRVPGEKQYLRIYLDEIQDISKAQWEIAKSLLLPQGIMFGIGDPYQSVFAWVGAYKHVFEDFEKTYKTKCIELLVNRRSGRKIVEAAEKIYPRGMTAFRDFDGSVTFGMPEDMSDLLILARTNSIIKGVSWVLKRRGIEHHLSLKGDKDESDYVEQGISVLRTCTRSKGEERRRVLVIDWQSDDSNGDRRLFYTAITRARDELYIAETGLRPSIFLRSILDGRGL